MQAQAVLQDKGSDRGEPLGIITIEDVIEELLQQVRDHALLLLFCSTQDNSFLVGFMWFLFFLYHQCRCYHSLQHYAEII